MTFSILFWNIWLDNQLNGEQGADKLLAELQRIIDRYQPDVIGLNEVLHSPENKAAFVIDFLKKKYGYTYTHYTPMSPIGTEWVVGSALCSKFKIESVRDEPISYDILAKQRGHPGLELKVITAQLKLPKSGSLNVLVAHPVNLRPETLKHHYDGVRSLAQLIRGSEFSRNTIIGGDFNEPEYLPRSFYSRVNDILHLKTGGRVHTTWRHNAYHLTPLRLNLDHIYWTKDSDFELTNFEMLRSNVSDHRPVFATFEC